MKWQHFLVIDQLVQFQNSLKYACAYRHLISKKNNISYCLSWIRQPEIPPSNKLTSTILLHKRRESQGDMAMCTNTPGSNASSKTAQVPTKIRHFSWKLVKEKPLLCLDNVISVYNCDYKRYFSLGEHVAVHRFKDRYDLYNVTMGISGMIYGRIKENHPKNVSHARTIPWWSHFMDKRVLFWKNLGNEEIEGASEFQGFC